MRRRRCRVPRRVAAGPLLHGFIVRSAEYEKLISGNSVFAILDEYHHAA